MPGSTLRTIPIEILRTIVAVAESRTFTKAAARLSISQPAVSAQIKRLQQIVGGDVFQKDIGGVAPTSLGKTVLHLARKTLDTHDQILRLSASSVGPERLRLGLSPLLVARFMNAQTSSAELTNVFVQSDQSDRLGRAFLDGRLDIACCLQVGLNPPADIAPFIVAEREDELVWVRSKNFVLSPGRPLPIVSWRGDDWLPSALAQHGVSYQVVFDGEDFEAKRAAVEAGQGLTVLPRLTVPPNLVLAREYYLPQLPPIKTVLYARAQDRSDTFNAMLGVIRKLFFKQTADSTDRHAI